MTFQVLFTNLIKLGLLGTISGMIYGFGFWYTRTQIHNFLLAKLFRFLALGGFIYSLLNLNPLSSIMVTLVFLVTFWLTILKLESNRSQWHTLQSLEKKPSSHLQGLD